MPIPSYDKFIEPVLRYLAAHPDGAVAHEVHDAAAASLGVSESEKLEILPSGVQPVYRNRAGWAHDRLKRAGLSTSPRRGFWKLGEKGLAFAAAHPGPLQQKQIEEIASSYKSVRLRPRANGDDAPDPVLLPDATASPDDRLAQALSELREATAEDLLQTISQSSPKFFERLVLDLLHAMGYGASRADLKEVGKPGDGGIDGVISLDRLGLEKVYVQAKRWQGTVGREAVQAFYGALAGQRATKGVFITTSDFTTQAWDFGRSVEKIVLIEGGRLAELLMDYGVGVSHREVKIPKIDNDYFDE